ncbi:MAG: ABC transporter ATP-binding protein [Minisyncoccia bacterium]
MAKSAIQADGLVITYNKGKSNEFNALKNICVDIHPREYIILFGPSGCGKSTLLYTMLGGVPPAGGHMYVRGEDIYAYSPAEMNAYQQSTIGIVYQQFNLISSISVLDNVALPMIFLNQGVEERNKRASDLLRRFGIPQRLEDKLPTMMSGGQQQRVAVARALVNDPEILLADEPVGNLDSISAEHVMDSFQDINEIDRKTVILVTHDAKYLPYAHRVFYMRDGELRRIVANPEKKQVKHVKPGETIVTEIEQLARLYPYAEPMELKVKSVVNFITQSMGFAQLERLEKGVLHVLKGTMDETMFAEYLKKGMRDGGVGVRDDDFQDLTKRVFALMRYSKDVARFREEVHQDSLFMHQQKFIDRLLEYLAEEIGITSSASQLQILKTSIAERVGGIINGNDFEERLVLPVDQGGAAYAEADAYHIARYLEKLIAQGGYIIRPNELEGAHS